MTTFSKKILVTGGAGFIGSNFLELMLEKAPNYLFVNFDKLSYASNLAALEQFNLQANYRFVHADLQDRTALTQAFETFQITDVLHLAAESHVDNSIATPTLFVEANVLGTAVLLDVARQFWFEAPFKPRAAFSESRFHHISTDEVYGSLGAEGYFTEASQYAPNSPYSASKASSDMMVRAYHHTYGFNTVITNCSNNYGPRQHDEKLIPTIIRNALQGKPIPIYGDGQNVRDWLFVTDHCEALDVVFHAGKAGETYCIGGNNEMANLNLATQLCQLLDTLQPKANGSSYTEQLTFVTDRPGHDRRYAIDASKLKNELNWEPKETAVSGLKKTLQWYLQHYLVSTQPHVNAVAV